MTNSEDQYPPDDFVIGESYPPPSLPAESDEIDGGEIGAVPGPVDCWSRSAPAPVIEDPSYYGDDDAQYSEDDEYYADDEAIGDPYYYYDDDLPARQPAFYVFIGIAVVLGGLFIFLLFSIFNGDDDDPATATDDPAFNIRIDSPQNNDRVQVGDDIEVLVSANSNEQISKIELMVGGVVQDQIEFDTVPASGVYSPTLSLNFGEIGNYDLVARATSESGATKESTTVRISVVTELVDEQPASITGEVITTVNARSGPGEEYPTVSTYEAGQRVVLVGKSNAGEPEWVLLDSGLWIRSAAVRVNDSLALLPVRRPTPTPAPTSTPTPEPSETATPEGGLPDLSPSNATLADDGNTLRVTVKNQSTADYQGPLVISAVGLPEGDLQEAFIVNVKAGGTQTVEFELPAANTDGGTVAISVDVGDNIEESNEDNNDATFLVSAAVDAPELTVSAVVNGPQINVTVTNVGGKLDTASVYVSVTLGVTNSSATRTISLETGQSEQFVVSTPPNSGVAEVTVFANGEALGSGSVQVGDPATATPEPTTEN